MKKIDLSGYPSPIVSCYEEVNENGDFAYQFRAMIRCFTAVLKYCSITVVSEYLVALDAGAAPSREMTECLAGKLFRPSLGHWSEFIREGLRVLRQDNRQPEGFFAELDKFYYKSKRKLSPNRGAILLNELITIRNDWLHPGLDPDPAQQPNLLKETGDRLEELLTLLGFLRDYPLFRYVNGNRESLMAVQTPLPPLTSTPLENGRVYLEHAAGKAIPLCVLAEFITLQEQDKEDILFFETAKQNDGKNISLIKYILGNRFSFDTCRYLAAAEALQHRLSINPRTPVFEPSGAEMDWAHVLTAASGSLEKTRRRLEESGKVIPGIMVERTSLTGSDGCFRQFLEDSAARVLVLLGDAGHGKSNALWRIADDPALQKNTATFLFEGRAMDAAGLGAQVAQVTNRSDGLPTLVNVLRAGNDNQNKRRVVFLIDGINECSSPQNLMRECLQLYHKKDIKGLRFVITCRTLAWQRIQASLDPTQMSLLFRQNKDGERRMPSLAVFSENEFNEAWSLYSKRFRVEKHQAFSPRTQRLLHDPLMLRLACMAYEGKTAPRDLDPGMVFLEFDRRLTEDGRLHSQRDEPFLKEILDAMWRVQRSSLTGTEIRSSSSLEAYVYEPTMEMPPGSVLRCLDCKSVLPMAGEISCDDPCPYCNAHKLETLNRDWRTTYERLQDEGVLSEDMAGDDMVLRFVYDSYFEFRMAQRLRQVHAPLGLRSVVELLQQVRGDDSPIFRECVKLVVSMDEQAVDIGIKLGRSESDHCRALATSLIEDLSKRGYVAQAKEIVEALSASGTEGRRVAMRAALEAGPPGELALTLPVPRGADQHILQQELSQILYRIWRTDTQRAVELMRKLASPVRLHHLVFKEQGNVQMLIDVTCKTAGALHHDPEVLRKLGDFWRDFANYNLLLGRRGLLGKPVSALVRFFTVNTLSRFASHMLVRHGITFRREVVSDDERAGLLTILDAWIPGNKTIKKLPDIVLTYGSEAMSTEQEESVISRMMMFLICPAGICFMQENVGKTADCFDQLFREAERLQNKGRLTRYFASSVLNYAYQLTYEGYAKDPHSLKQLEPVLDVLTQQYSYLLKHDPESFIPVNLMGAGKVPNMRFGIYCQALIRAGHDPDERILVPLLESLPDFPVSQRVGLVQAFFRSCAITNDTFSRRADAQHSWLSMLKRFTTDIKAMAEILEINVETYRDWLAEAFAIIAVGYPAEVELHVIQNPNLPDGFVLDIASSRSEPGVILAGDGHETIEQYVNGLGQSWALADGGNSMVALFPSIRDYLHSRLRTVIQTGDLTGQLRIAIGDVLALLVESEE